MPSSAKIVVLGSHPRDTGALQVYELSKGQLNLILEVKSVLQLECGYCKKKKKFKLASFPWHYSQKKRTPLNVGLLEHPVYTSGG